MSVGPYGGQKSVGSPTAGVRVSHLYVCWHPNLDPLEELKALVTSEPSRQLHGRSFLSTRCSIWVDAVYGKAEVSPLRLDRPRSRLGLEIVMNEMEIIRGVNSGSAWGVSFAFNI